MITLYTWDGTFDPADFGKALSWISRISQKLWQNVSSDFFIYFIICVFVLPPVIYVIGSYIIDMVNYKPSFEKIYYDNGRGLYSANNTVYGNIVKYSKFKKNKKVEQPPYDIIKEKVVDEYGNVTEMKYKNGKYVGSTSYVDNQPPNERINEKMIDEFGNVTNNIYQNGKYVGSNSYIDNKPPYSIGSKIIKDGSTTLYMDYDKGKYKGSRTYELILSEDMEEQKEIKTDVNKKINIEYDEES